jgi:hypothetical protein
MSDTDLFLAALQHADQVAVREQLARDPRLRDRLSEAALLHLSQGH